MAKFSTLDENYTFPGKNKTNKQKTMNPKDKKHK